MGHLPVHGIRQVSNAIESMRHHSIKIYEEKKAAVMMDLENASVKATDLENDSDAILAALSTSTRHV